MNNKKAKKKVKEEKKQFFMSRCASTCRRWRGLSLSCEFSRRDLIELRKCFSGHRKQIKRFVFMEAELKRTNVNVLQEELEKRKSRLEEQMAEAEELKKFRDKRGKAILVLVESLLTSEERENYVAMLEKMVRVVGERKEVEEKITRGEQQIQALTEALR